MKYTFLPPIIRITEPDKPPQGCRLLIRIEDTLNYPERYPSFYQKGNFLTILRHWLITPKNKPVRLGLIQLDVPLDFLPWFIKKFEFFITPSTQGGMPAGKMSTDEDIVSGEDIRIISAMDGGNVRKEGGYMVYNFSRQDQSPGGQRPQNLTFSDSFMFDGGLLDLFKTLADKHQNGTL
jgi:hypothetical protein